MFIAKRLLLAVAIIANIVLVFFVCDYVGEHFFFDKFIYYKRVDYGYWVPNKNLQLKDFGNRAKDIQLLQSLTVSASNSSQQQDDFYAIALIGDSYIWGQGLRDDQRLPVILENKLNKIKKTKVYSFALSGDNALDNYLKYKIIKDRLKIDLYIFVIVDNDALLSKQPHYLPAEYNQIVQNCQGQTKIEPIYDINENTQSNVNYYELFTKAFNNPTNRCVLNTIIPLYPNNNAIYFIASDYTGDPLYKTYQELLSQQNLHVISSDMAHNIPEYVKYWLKPDDYFRISKVEKHPSKLAVDMYTTVLVNTITSNNQYHFKENQK